ncbi:hypothetical protein Taro_000671, partial [Colocasia esculenta]|nr:hypothetical protein [Colocasia esculenta]
MKEDPTMWRNFRRRRVPERQRESSQESRTNGCTTPIPIDPQKGFKRKGVYQERRQASLKTGHNFESEEHKRDDDIPRISVFQHLGATMCPRQKKRRTVQITEEGMRIYTCYASNINLPVIADQTETSNMEQHPTMSSRRREQARAWFDRVNVQVDLPPQNEGGMGAADIATTSNHPLDQSRSVKNPNIRVPSLPNLEMVMQENQKLKAMLEGLMQQLGMAAPPPPQPSPPIQPLQPAQQLLQPQQVQQAGQPALPAMTPQPGNMLPRTNISCKGSVDTPLTGVDTMLQDQAKMLKKWSSSVDTRPSQVDTRGSSQRTMSTGLYSRSTPDAVRSTLESLPRRPVDTRPSQGDTRDLSQGSFSASLGQCVDTRPSQVDTLRK